MKKLINKVDVVSLEQKMVETIGLELDIFLDSATLAKKITDLISFHRYFLSAVSKSLLLGLLGFIAFSTSLFTFGESVLMGIVFSVFGLIPFIFLSSVQGLVNFLNRLQSDITAILNLSLEIVESILNELQKKTIDTVSNTPAVSKIISDLILFGIIPKTVQIIRQRIPVFGGAMANLMQFILKKMEIVLKTRTEGIIMESTHLQNIDQHQQKIVKTTEETISEYHQTSLRLLNSIKENSHNIVGEIFGLVTQPFRKWQVVAYILVTIYIVISVIITT